LEQLRKHTGGLDRGEIIQSLNLKGDKSGEQGVSNALNALTKAKKVSKNGSKYVVV
jgi:hypothetical protein